MITTPIRQRSSAVIALVAVALLLFAGCGSDDGDDESTGAGEGTESTTTEAPSSADGSTASSAPAQTGSEETDPVEPSETTTGATEGQLSPGDPCSLEEGDPDCIDPDGDGEGTYLTDGAECAATAPDIIACEDLDGDGVAGAPDEYEGLPTCSAEVPPPCNNPPGSGEK